MPPISLKKSSHFDSTASTFERYDELEAELLRTFDKVWLEMSNIRLPNEKSAALAPEPVGLTVGMGMEMVGPDVIETGIDDAVLGRPKLVEETSFDHPKAVEAVAEMEVQLDTCVIRELRPDVVPFDGSEVPLIAIADDSALCLLESERFEPVDVK